jgi:hypothetical protein
MWHWHWIKKDIKINTNLYDSWIFWQKTNVYMDKLAKSFMAQANAQDMDFGNCLFAEEGWSVAYRHEKLLRLITDDLYQDLMAQKMIAYWIGKGHTTLATSMQINWPLIKTAMKRVSLSQRHWVLKHACGF